VSEQPELPSRQKTSHHWLDRVGTIAAIVVSVVSLYIAIQNSQTEHQLVSSSAWPFIGAIESNDYNQGREVAIGVINEGVGPAKLRTYEVFYDGAPVRSALDLLRHCCGLGPTTDDIRRQLPHGYNFSIADETVMRAGDNNIILSVPRVPEAPGVAEQLNAHLGHISFRACYCSILDECWITDLQHTQVTPIHECAAPAHPYAPNGR
jgi:hypothetical protein